MKNLIFVILHLSFSSDERTCVELNLNFMGDSFLIFLMNKNILLNKIGYLP